MLVDRADELVDLAPVLAESAVDLVESPVHPVKAAVVHGKPPVDLLEAAVVPRDDAGNLG